MLLTGIWHLSLNGLDGIGLLFAYVCHFDVHCVSSAWQTRVEVEISLPLQRTGLQIALIAGAFTDSRATAMVYSSKYLDPNAICS